MTARVYQIAVEVLRPSSAIQYNVVVTDSVALTEATPMGWNLATTLTDSASLSEVVSRFSTGDIKEITDSVTATDATALKMTYPKTRTESVVVSDAVAPVWPIIVSVTSAPLFEDAQGFAYGRTATDSVAHTDSAARTLRALPVLRETVSLPLTLTPKTNYRLTQAETISLRIFTNGAFPKSLTESLAISDTTARALALRVIERLGLVDVVTGAGKYGRTLAETVRFLDSLAKFLFGDVAETLTVTDAVARVNKTTRTATEAAALTGTASPKLVLRLVTQDALNLSDAQVLKLLFRPTLRESIEISAAYVNPGSGITTWAVNTKTGATTEYTNYDFNSFAEFGRSYLGASRSGLYELKGDDDQGDDIIAKMKTGILQFFNANHTHIYGIYMAARGDGDYLLRVETKGETRTYSVKVESMKTARTQIGKGVRARYFSFELESTGQDFDLEHIRFVPIVARRRS